MDIDELELSFRSHGVLKKAGIDTVEDLCRLTAEQLLHLGNFGRKCLREVEEELKRHSLSLHAGPPDPRLLVSSLKVKRLNPAFSVSNTDRASLARYMIRELAQIEESLRQVASQLDRPQRTRLLIINGHVGLLRSVHEAILEQSPEPPESDGAAV